MFCGPEKNFERIEWDQVSVRTKSLAQILVCWPNIDENVEEVCGVCSAFPNGKKQAFLQLSSMEFSSYTKVTPSLDFVGPVNGNSYLVRVDAHSK